MDVLPSIATGLTLRLFLNSLNNQALRWLGPVLVGSWEGVALYHLSSKFPLDHYLAYALRLAVDFYFTSNLLREFIVLLFTILAFIASEFFYPPRPRRVHHRRSSRNSVPTPIRHYASDPIATPSTHAMPPPTPPSTFLQPDSDLSYAYSEDPLKTPTDDNDNSSTLSRSTALPLPTPPPTLLSETRPPHFIDRLSTIEEQSSGEEGTKRSYPAAISNPLSGNPNPTYTPSVTTPLPVPNSTIRYTRQALDAPETPPTEAPPLQVPNASTRYYMSEDEGGDPLQTPPPAGTSRWDLALTDDDGLTTPPPRNDRELSPLVLDQNLLPSFGQVTTTLEGSNPPPPTAVVNTVTTEATTGVESPSVVSPRRDPDIILEPTLEPQEPEPERETGPELVSTYPTPVPSPTGERPGHDRDHDEPPSDDKRAEDAEQETETETDTASMISSHPAAIMYLRAEALRNEARAAETEYIRLKEQLKRAKGVRDSLFLQQQVQEQEERARKLHIKAAKRFFRARNALRKRRSHTVDVHGLRVAEAVYHTEQALRNAYTDKAPLVRVIVGKGLHSVGKVPVLKEAIMKIMMKRGVPCNVDPGNTGVLVLRLPGSD
ncbi:hypothetical protein H0H93_005844 [Arthromyces matolae]|nr:hypothetical protein H0H93_005844 [Arthromyces matolae]